MPDPADPGEPTEPPADQSDSDSDGRSSAVDFGWVMQVTFVVTIIVGAPIVALLSAGVTLPTWEARVSFAVRVGAIVWLCTAIGVFWYAKFYRSAQSEA